MSTAKFTVNRYQALAAVSQGKICYNNGLLEPAPGYDWVTGETSQMTDDLRHALRDLWAADLIDIDTHHLFERGHQVRITTRGYPTLRAWSVLARREYAA
ncbi:hypothetical protein [Amycolatopsis alkalitolerans]|uniref:Uncharacterized protein n=1 Tax=Amycolatopsis alkalitolerans TaxID=2547244 RepID=A0A5C4LV14_9PSEU|nr:hypothetical protein [Amycolatopsis alkalitolerans]TNC19394.1 hypothetical protein FG385_32440 [Amycolatopsis alkalitolerans]